MSHRLITRTRLVAAGALILSLGCGDEKNTAKPPGPCDEFEAAMQAVIDEVCADWPDCSICDPDNWDNGASQATDEDCQEALDAWDHEVMVEAFGSLCEMEADTDTDWDPCPAEYYCVSEAVCAAADGILHPDLVCGGAGVCCEIGSDTDTYETEAPCPYSCTFPGTCGGEVHWGDGVAEYTCNESSWSCDDEPASCADISDDPILQRFGCCWEGVLYRCDFTADPPSPLYVEDCDVSGWYCGPSLEIDELACVELLPLDEICECCELAPGTESDPCGGYTGEDECCINWDVCDLALNDICDCESTCAWDAIDCEW